MEDRALISVVIGIVLSRPGLIVSGATLLACLGYLGWEVVRRKKKKLVATTTIKKEEDI
jgi:hypothetical protein